jgi:hypothetical protein
MNCLDIKLRAKLQNIERACEPGMDRSDDELEQFIVTVRKTITEVLDATIQPDEATSPDKADPIVVPVAAGATDARD